MNYTPDYCHDITVKYTVINPGEPAEEFYPGCDPEIEIDGIEVNGCEVSEYLFDHLMRHHDFEVEILEKLRGMNVKNIRA